MSVPPQPPRAASERPHALIVSANADLTTFVSEGLLYAGFWTSSVASALQTLELFRLRTFDLILIDLDLGGFGALELVRRLRDPFPGVAAHTATPGPRADIPILLLAGDPSAVPSADLDGVGVDDLLVAPFELEDLVARCHGTMAKRRAS